VPPPAQQLAGDGAVLDGDGVFKLARPSAGDMSRDDAWDTRDFVRALFRGKMEHDVSSSDLDGTAAWVQHFSAEMDLEEACAALDAACLGDVCQRRFLNHTAAELHFRGVRGLTKYSPRDLRFATKSAPSTDLFFDRERQSASIGRWRQELACDRTYSHDMALERIEIDGKLGCSGAPPWRKR